MKTYSKGGGSSTVAARGEGGREGGSLAEWCKKDRAALGRVCYDEKQTVKHSHFLPPAAPACTGR